MPRYAESDLLAIYLAERTFRTQNKPHSGCQRVPIYLMSKSTYSRPYPLHYPQGWFRVWIQRLRQQAIQIQSTEVSQILWSLLRLISKIDISNADLCTLGLSLISEWGGARPMLGSPLSP
jgi:hypothetical protein